MQIILNEEEAHVYTYVMSILNHIMELILINIKIMLCFIIWVKVHACLLFFNVHVFFPFILNRF